MPLFPGCTQNPHLDAFSVGWLINGHWKKRPSSLDYMWQHVPSRNSPAALHLGRKQQIPGPFKECQSIPYPLPFYRSESCQGQAGDGGGRGKDGGTLPGQALPGQACSSGSFQGAQPCSRAHLCVQTCSLSGLSSRRSRCFCPRLGSRQETPRPAVPVQGSRSKGRLSEAGSKDPFLGCLRPWDSGSDQHSGLTCPLVLGTRAPSPGGRRGHVAAFPAEGGAAPASRLGSRVTWNVSPLLPVWAEAGRAGVRGVEDGGETGWRNQKPGRRAHVSFSFLGHPWCRRLWLGEETRQLPLSVLRQREKGGAPPPPRAPANTSERLTRSCTGWGPKAMATTPGWRKSHG